ncbi:kinase-like protein [Aspergillus uvarum CBS 121591]|uniref:Kinase-like protein n=1 Tax=Aspergillus uvarum CBS 121591 TaxID=1448315 RepID=A0A319D3F7_9EURO|nr:kinase-like protein [Aspergillus uvarum CBS 121591]PYH82428.1 kinase-like protein [Aspergillus uvarum CBS 121591]
MGQVSEARLCAVFPTWFSLARAYLSRGLIAESTYHLPSSLFPLQLPTVNKNARYAGYECEVEEHITTADPSHCGCSLIRTLLNSFEPLSMYQPRFADGRMLLPLIKTYIRTLLTGLDYLHQECRVVHTDLKREDIMSQLERRMASKIDSTERLVYQSCNDFGSLKSPRSVAQLVDFGLATRLAEDDDWGIWPIQPDHYRAPQVILGIGWQMPAIFGTWLWDLVEGKELFQRIYKPHGRYDAKRHIAQMIALPGPPALEILGRYQSMRTLCETAEEYFCGPFFDNNETVCFLKGEEKEAFLDLVRKMLLWNHNYRRQAGGLAGLPFLQPQNRAIHLIVLSE